MDYEDKHQGQETSNTLAVVLVLVLVVGFIFYLYKKIFGGNNNGGSAPYSPVPLRPVQSSDPVQPDFDDDDDEKEEPPFISRREWVKYLTGMPEPELRKGNNIKSVIRAESVPEHNTHRFTFVNNHTKREYDAGYFYTESVGAMQEEFERRPGDKGAFKSCKLVADLRQDYVTNGFHFTSHTIYTTQSPLIFPP